MKVDDLTALYRAEFPRLTKSLAVAFTADVAADSVQEAFIEAFRLWPRVKAYDDPAGWVRRVAINKAKTKARDRRRRSEVGPSYVTPVHDDQLAALRLDVRRALKQLPERTRLAICLHYLGGLKVTEIAEVMEVHPGTVKSTLHDGRYKLERELKVKNDAR